MHKTKLKRGGGGARERAGERARETVDQVERQSVSIIADAGNSRHSVVSLWSVSIETHFYGQVLSVSLLSGWSLLVGQNNQRNPGSDVDSRRNLYLWTLYIP